MKDEVIIQRVSEEDYESVVWLISLIGPRYTADPKNPKTKEVFNHYLKRDDRKIGLVAKINDQVVGVMLFEISPMLTPTHLYARGDGIAVDPNYQKSGIAKKLIDETFRICAENKVTSMMCAASSDVAIKMYRARPELKERGIYLYYDPDSSVVS